MDFSCHVPSSLSISEFLENDNHDLYVKVGEFLHYRRCFQYRVENDIASYQRRAEVSDLTRGNLVFSSLNSKRSRVSLGLGTRGGGRERVEAAAAAARGGGGGRTAAAAGWRCWSGEEMVEVAVVTKVGRGSLVGGGGAYRAREKERDRGRRSDREGIRARKREMRIYVRYERRGKNSR